MNIEFWKNKKVFITGHTGFKGGWLSLWLAKMGAEVKGYSLPPDKPQSFFSSTNLSSILDSQIGDIRDEKKLLKSLDLFKPEIVFHLAAQPLVRRSYQEPMETFHTNIIGTSNLLNSLRGVDTLRAVIVVTTDKCYENNDLSVAFKESDPLGGKDPYSASKACAEIVTYSFKQSYFKQQDIGVATARAGNVIGGGDWSDDRLIPDALRSFSINETLTLRNPNSIRPWQYVLEPCLGYLVLAEKLFDEPSKFSSSFNFGPSNKGEKKVSWIIENLSKYFKDPSWEQDQSSNPDESKILKLNTQKAKKLLAWNPKYDLEKTLEKIYQWHHHASSNGDMREYSLKEIDEYFFCK